MTGERNRRGGEVLLGLEMSVEGGDRIFNWGKAGGWHVMICIIKSCDGEVVGRWKSSWDYFQVVDEDGNMSRYGRKVLRRYCVLFVG